MARPREFDADEALERAMGLFWAKGYHDSSIRDLVARTGVNYYGLYSVFTDKQGLLLAALDRYRDTVTAEAIAELKKPGPISSAVRKALTRLLALMQTVDGRVGCLMCNAAVEVAPAEPAVAAKVEAHMALLRDAFRNRLSAARAAGELAAEKDIGALAEFLGSTAYSLGFLLRAGCSDAYLQRHIRTALTVLD